MDTSTSPSNGIAKFIPGLALFRGVTPVLLRTDFIVAVTVFAVLVPSSMAYGDLAGVNPVAGLYVAVAAMVMYALFGTSRQVIMGPEATSAIMTAAAVAPLAGNDPARYATLVALTAILVGIVSLLCPRGQAGFHHRLPVQADPGRLHLWRDPDRDRQPAGQDVRHLARERQVLPAGPGDDQPPRRSAPADRHHWHRLHGRAVPHAPDQSRPARSTDRGRGVRSSSLSCWTGRQKGSRSLARCRPDCRS